MRTVSLGAMAACLACVLALVGGPARADTKVGLFKSFAGNVNFVGTQKTMRTKPNGNGTDACAVTPASSNISATLSGVPATATILSAQLYWAGSSSTADNTVNFDGQVTTAPAARQYFSNTIGSGYDYFGGAADVTAQVAAKGNGTYTFSGLTINNGEPYCSVEGVLGGFALLVVYSDPAEQFRVLNVYEGFQFMRYSALTLTLSNFRTPSPLGKATGRVGHITWEGDASLGANGEDLLFNGVQMFDALNPKQNQFNSASNINNDPASYGIDFDAYTVGSNALSAGQTSATSTYQSGQDLVLLNAEVIAVPNVPASDLAIAITRNSALTQYQNAVYTFSVSNGGPNVETGPVVVTDTLPPGMSYISAAGTGWSCSNSGKTVTCTRPGSVAVGATLPILALTVSVDGTGTMVNTASVGGQLFDFNSSNNTASDSANTIAADLYVYTDSACVHGKAFGSAQQTCKQLDGSIPVIAGAATPMFITAVTAGVPTRLSASADTTVPMTFALSCVNPVSNAGVKATYAGTTLPLCTPNGGVPGLTGAEWSPSVNMVFKSGAPSVVAGASFLYADVGKVILYLRDSANRLVDSVPFVVKPDSLAITSVTRSADGFVNPQAANGADFAFARAGEAFTINVAARTRSGAVAPNFGSEGALVTLDVQRGGDTATQNTMLDLPVLAGSFTASIGGVFTGSAFTVDDAGILAVTPRLTTNDYLGAGAPSASATMVGRFYPDHFDTATTATLSCLPHMNCPLNVSGAAYSAQAFAVTVRPMNAGGNVLRNYFGVLARPVTLAAYDQPGGATQNPSGGSLSANGIAVAAMTPDQPIGAVPVYAFPSAFSQAFGGTPARNWIAPTPVYLRASASENIAGGGSVTVSSLRGSASVEGGLTIISGRLALENPHGSELQKMPVKAAAQYWAATGRWETSASDMVSTLQNGGIAFANCLVNLKPCSTAVLGVAAPGALTMNNGIATFWLKAPGTGKNGSAEFQMNNPAWLPSTVSRAVFGVYKAGPVIYVREMY